MFLSSFPPRILFSSLPLPSFPPTVSDLFPRSLPSRSLLRFYNVLSSPTWYHFIFLSRALVSSPLHPLVFHFTTSSLLLFPPCFLSSHLLSSIFCILHTLKLFPASPSFLFNLTPSFFFLTSHLLSSIPFTLHIIPSFPLTSYLSSFSSSLIRCS